MVILWVPFFVIIQGSFWTQSVASSPNCEDVYSVTFSWTALKTCGFASADGGLNWKNDVTIHRNFSTQAGLPTRQESTIFPLSVM